MVRKSILIVDYDLGILKSFKEILEPEGYSVDTAETALEAVEKSKAHPYNLAIIDIKQRETERMNEENVVGWVESRYEETRRNRSKRKPMAPELLPNAED